MFGLRIFSVFVVFAFLLTATLKAEAHNANLQAGNDEGHLRSFWESDAIEAIGHGVAPKKAATKGEAKFMAEQAASMDAYRKLAEYAAGVKITANSKATKKEVSAIITGAVIVSSEFDEDNNCTVIMRVPLYGVKGLMSKVDITDITKDAPEAFPGTSEIGSGNYTGLIIDCSEVKENLSPVLMPKVETTTNKSVYGANNFSRAILKERGMVSYAANMDGNTKRAGDNPLIIKAVGLKDDGSSPVISKADARLIRMENQSSHFLESANVVFLSTRGHRDSIKKSGGDKTDSGLLI